MSKVPRRIAAAPLPEVAACLNPLRAGFLALHKALLDSERTAYEAQEGPIENNLRFLQLVMEDDSWFSWLRPMSQFIIQIDEALEEASPRTLASVEPLLAQARDLLKSSESGSNAEQRLFQVLNRGDDAAFHYADLRRLLNNLPGA